MILSGDCRDVLTALAECSVDAIVTDPPYDLTAGKNGGSGAASVNLDSPYGRARIGTGNGGGGFMGLAWDATGVAFDPDTWRAALRVLKPGGHLLAFGGTRTYHRMAVAIEDAGFEIRDQLQWLYGSGFPKSLNIGDGRGTALKPANEPICLARKPLIGTVAANVLEHGTGALNIDGCRIGAADALVRPATARDDNTVFGKGLGAGTQVEPAGRWPANVLLDEEAAAALDAQTGTLTSGANPTRRGSDKFRGIYSAFTGQEQCEPARGQDSGGASRFYYVAKPSKAERGEGNTHPTVKPVTLLRYLVRLVTPPGGLVLDPFAGSGTTLLAAQEEGFRYLGIELNPDYIAIAERRLAQTTLGVA